MIVMQFLLSVITTHDGFFSNAQNGYDHFSLTLSQHCNRFNDPSDLWILIVIVLHLLLVNLEWERGEKL